jgi:hypothetical protein
MTAREALPLDSQVARYDEKNEGRDLSHLPESRPSLFFVPLAGCQGGATFAGHFYKRYIKITVIYTK